ncbi:PepSY-associated TM helix domain-containing protein [Aneurinibacillus migulanus]|uniref:Uncharacterized iron-regulated membrane protein n=1 Tax=Aneurinibacillus migulanus TaxID=47500 RepID=A0A0D1X6J0_ANEMI|nr:PepSY-associated TM helix domain-containing protein [Aneurinibacillus migulanus]KIV50101.1 hypothetical protein TS65_30085 [Aneurinibacillus migulanus]KON96127.1 hypothetical protein AF333_12175 [Aneurinibacillus migulanus]MED0894613.1 PepSY-associated TM helix domain-containing protein [Aneurinibacillus migulanus]MED1616309.1 PepSY-associated TM helix domain-containing protein [Aneurinibacillus migulanus]SDI72483.1 Uncharacterized iron-regulated membrane protein [Aneurinibacillus migulanus
MNVKKVLRAFHLWLSLIAGLLICVIGITGSLLVFQDELSPVIYSDYYKVTPGKKISYEQAYQTVLSAHPKAEVQRIYMEDSSAAQGVYKFRIKENKHTKEIFIDPGTGQLSGELNEHSFFNWTFDLHETLLLKDYNGKEIVAIIGIFLFFITVSGIFLWWPGIKKWVQGFKIRRGKNLYVSNYDIHKVFGIFSVPFLLVVSLTGILFTFDKEIFGFFGANAKIAPPKEMLVSQPLPQGKMPIDRLVEIAKKEIPDGTVTQIRMPAKPKAGKKEGAVELRMSHGYDPSQRGAGNVRVWLDSYSGKVIEKYDATINPRLTYQTWLFPLHTGLFGGAFTKVLYVIGGLMPTLLMATGTYMWLYKSRKKKESAKRQVRSVA